MTVSTIAPLSLLVAALAACRAPLPQQPGRARLAALFGPVVSHEVIRGRVDAAHVVTLLVSSTLVRVDLAARRESRIAIGVAPGAGCWGLARLDDGSMWTLKGHSALIRIETDGRVSSEIPLLEPHVGLFGAGERLIFQKAALTPPGPALTAGTPGAMTSAPWSAMQTRVFPGIARAQSTALNMIACGGSTGPARPCWFPDEAAVSLIDSTGNTRRLTLPGLIVVSPETLLAAENPPRPVRDAFVDRRGRIWVLSTGVPPGTTLDVPGGWLLARYTGEGTADGQVRFDEPVRLILHADDERVVVLSGNGYVSEVKSW
jgi:hypothetical protein